MSGENAIGSEIISLCQDALRLPIENFREQLFASGPAQDSPPLREVLMAINNRAESNRKYRNLISEIAELSERFTTDEDAEHSLGRVLGLARQMLGTDAAFVMEHDEERSCGTILLSSGVWTSEFQEIEPSGAGLFFEILDVESPLQVASYLRDKSFTHEPELDSRVKREGFRAFLGIPILAEDEPARVLFVADRHERIYHSGDIFILEQLALQGSVVLRLFGQRAETSLQLGAAEEKLSGVSVELKESQERDRLLSQILELAQSPNCSSKIERFLSRETGVEVEILSISQLAADTALHRLDGPLRASIVANVQAATSAGQLSQIEAAGQSGHIWPLFMEGRPWGALVSVSSEIDGASGLLRQVAQMLSVCSLGGSEDRIRTFAESSNTFFSLFHYGYGQLTAAQKARLQDLDIPADRPNRVAILQGEVQNIVEFLEKISLDAGSKVLIGVGQDQIGLVGRNDRVIQIIELLQKAQSLKFAELGLSVFVSDSFDSLDKATVVFQECQEYVRVVASLRLTAPEGWFTAATLPKSLQLLSRLTENQRNSLVSSSIGPVLEYDREHNTELFETAQALVQNQFSVSAAASELFVHANTIRHRMRKLDELLGNGWNAGFRLLDFQLAVFIVAGQQSKA